LCHKLGEGSSALARMDVDRKVFKRISANSNPNLNPNFNPNPKAKKNVFGKTK